MTSSSELANLNKHFEAVLEGNDPKGHHQTAIRSIVSERTSDNSVVNEIVKNYTPQQIRDAFMPIPIQVQLGIEPLVQDEFERTRVAVEILSIYYSVKPEFLNSEIISKIKPSILENLTINPQEVTPLNFEDSQPTYYLNDLNRSSLGIGTFDISSSNLSKLESRLIYIKDIYKDFNLRSTLNVLGFDYNQYMKERAQEGRLIDDAEAMLFREVKHLISFVRENISKDEYASYRRSYSDTLPYRFGEDFFEPIFSDTVLELNPEDFARVLKSIPQVASTKYAESGSWYNAMRYERALNN